MTLFGCKLQVDYRQRITVRIETEKLLKALSRVPYVIVFVTGNLELDRLHHATVGEVYVPSSLVRKSSFPFTRVVLHAVAIVLEPEPRSK